MGTLPFFETEKIEREESGKKSISLRKNIKKVPLMRDLLLRSEII